MKPRKLRMDGAEIPYSDSLKYLGVTFDSKLLWKVHILDKIRKAKVLLIKLVQAIGTAWGPLPWLARWAYIGIVRPM